MAWERENACYGCAECIGCGRKHRYYNVCYCDICGDEIPNVVFLLDNKEVCNSCAAEAIFDAYTAESERDEVYQRAIDEGYDVNNVDDVIALFNVPMEKQPDRFPAFRED